ncbi:MAG: UDP-2,3-diacylglucosamine diphosphatase [Cellvibrionaceae bacterium]
MNVNVNANKVSINGLESSELDDNLVESNAQSRDPHRIQKANNSFRTLFISDVHLGCKDSHAELLLDFLNAVQCETLFLVGDIFDMLAMKQRIYWPESHSEVLKAIYRMAQSGTNVIYIPGNHDMPMRYFERGMLLNVELHDQVIHETADGKKLLVVHGDEFDHAVLYNALNRLIGDHAYGLMVFLNRSLHKIRSLFGFQYWSLATFLKENISQARQTIETFEKAAIGEARQRGLDGVVCGHIHKAALKKEGGITYCNDGDWTETCSALVEHQSGALELLDIECIRDIIAHHGVTDPNTKNTDEALDKAASAA